MFWIVLYLKGFQPNCKGWADTKFKLSKFPSIKMFEMNGFYTLIGCQ